MSFQAPYLSSTASALIALQTGPFTITGWFEPTVPGDTYTATPFLTGPAWSIGLNTDGTLSFFVNNSVSDTSTTVSTVAAINAGWNFWAVTYDPSAMVITIWLNGVVASTTLLALADSTESSVSPFGDFELGSPNLVSSVAPDGFSMDAVGVWARVLSSADIGEVYNAGQGNPYPFLGGPFTLIFQANLVNDTPTPLVIASQDSVFNVNEQTSESSGVNDYEAYMNLLYQGVAATPGYNWTADNFSDKVILAQHDNPPLYWTPPAALALPLPGLPVGSQYDGVAVFQNIILLWQEDNLLWSDQDSFTCFIPVAETAVSAVLNLLSPFAQPPPGGSVTVQVNNPEAIVSSLSLAGDLSFPDTAVNSSSQLLLTLENTGNAIIDVTGITMPGGITSVFSPSVTTGTIAVGGSLNVIITFKPTASTTYSGTVVIGSTATTGTSTYPISGTGTGTTIVMNLSGNYNFGSVVVKTHSYQPQPGFLLGYILVTNPGNTTLSITGITLPDGFSTTFTTGTVSGTTSPSVAPGTLVIPITFTPTAVKSYTGDITLTSNATSGVNFVAVSGAGVSSLTTPVVFINDAGACEFGFLTAGDTSSAVEVTITNTAGVYINVFPILPATLVTGFVIGAPVTGGPGHALAPYASTTFTVTFEPVLAQPYGGTISIDSSLPSGSLDYESNEISIGGTGTTSGPQIVVSGSVNFGDVPYGSTLAAMLSIYNPGQSDLDVTSIDYSNDGPPAIFAGPSSITVAPGQTVNSLIYFTPYASDETVQDVFSGDITADTNVPNGLGGYITVSYPITGTGIPVPAPVPLVADQVVTLTDTSQPGQTYYNYYTVVSMTGTSLALILQNLTGATPAGSTVAANGVQFFTVDANQAGSTIIAGARMNGPILKIIPQGDYAYVFKSRSIQSIAYTGLGNGTFFIHNEISGEGLIGRNAVTDSGDGRMFLLGFKELYVYEGGPKLQPIAQQYTKQLFAELDRTRLDSILLFHNENRKEIWVIYPVTGGTFKILIWSYVEDSATIDIYAPTGGVSLQLTAIGLVDWSNDPTWASFASSDTANEATWLQFPTSTTWASLVSAGLNHVPVFGSVDGGLRIHGTVYDREGLPYVCLSETMDYSFDQPDLFKYCDVVVLALQLSTSVAGAPGIPPGATMYVQVGTQETIGDANGITWSAPYPILVDGSQPTPVKVNPGGSGRYFRLRFYSNQLDCNWRVAAFEIHARPGNTY